MSERQKISDSEYDAPDSRRSFLKKLGIFAGVTAAGAVGVDKYMDQQEKEREEILAEMLNAPTEDFRVRPWGEAPDAGEEDDATTISELRENAGWDADYEAEFEKVVDLKNPGSISKDHTIQPGWYKVPVNKDAETR